LTGLSQLAVRHAFSAAGICLVLLSGCAHEPYAISGTDRERFKAGIIRATLAGRTDPLIEGVSDCTVYRAEIAHEDIVGWKAVLGADWGASYPKFMTVCTRQSIAYDGKYVTVLLCAQAIGAGGGCANGGSYRSRDGEHRWQYARGGTGWEPLRP